MNLDSSDTSAENVLAYSAAHTPIILSKDNQLLRRPRHRHRKNRQRSQFMYYDGYAPLLKESESFQTATPPYSPYQYQKNISEEGDEARWDYHFKSLDGWCERRVQELGAQLQMIVNRHAAYWGPTTCRSQVPIRFEA